MITQFQELCYQRPSFSVSLERGAGWNKGEAEIKERAPVEIRALRPLGQRRKEQKRQERQERQERPAEHQVGPSSTPCRHYEHSRHGELAIHCSRPSHGFRNARLRLAWSTEEEERKEEGKEEEEVIESFVQLSLSLQSSSADSKISALFSLLCLSCLLTVRTSV